VAGPPGLRAKAFSGQMLNDFRASEVAVRHSWSE